ncbi:hypothetical protein ACSQ67_009838 [Phaseolus vulgaris]
MEVIAQIVLQNLNSFAQEEFGIIWNLKDDVKQMKRTVSAIKAVLLDAEAKTNNLQISNWLEELKDVLYDADDLLSDMSSEALERKLVVGKEYAFVEGKKENIGNKTRYLSSCTSLHFSEKTSSSSSKLRTVILLGQTLYGSQNLGQPLLHFPFLSSIKRVRVLTLCGLHIITLPNSIRELKQLRYLDLSKNKFLVSLPPDVTSLLNLQTLKLSQCGKLKELPSDINKSLRHLELNDCEELTCMPCGLGKLTNLQTLTHFLLDCKSKNGDISELSGLNNLRGKLVIKWLDSLRENAAVVESAKTLIEKQHLQELELWWWLREKKPFPDDPIEERRRMEEESRWLENEKILLEDEKMLASRNKMKKDEKILQGLQPHHSIKKLVIDGYCGKSLPDWIGNLSSLLNLEIRNCNGLKSLPHRIQYLVSLERICIYNCPLLERRCARGYGEEWSKIAHIPKVFVSPFSPTALSIIQCPFFTFLYSSFPFLFYMAYVMNGEEGSNHFFVSITIF